MTHEGRLTVVYSEMGGFGWDSVEVMVRLLSELLEARL